LQAPASCTVEIQPIDLPRAKDGSGYEIPLSPIIAVVSAATLSLDHVPSLVEPVTIANLNGELQMYGSPEYRVFTYNCDMRIGRAKADRNICGVRIQARAETKEGRLVPHADVGLADLSVSELERVLGKPAAT